MYNDIFWSKNRVDNPKKFQHEYDSFCKKFLGNKHEVWFLSLDEKKRWDLLFEWKKYKYFSRKKNSTPSFKKFVDVTKLKRKYRVSKQKLREIALNKIIQ